MAMHPMSLGEILDGGLTLLKANFRPMVALTALFVVPLQLITAYLSRDVFGGAGLADLITQASVAGTAVTSGPGSSVAFGVSTLAAALVMPVLIGALCRVAASSYLGTTIRAREALKMAARRWPSFVGAWILVHLVEGAAGVVLLLPALGAMALSMAVSPALAVEELRATAALKRSYRLLWSRFFPTVGVALATVAVSSGISVAISIVPEVLALLVGYDRGWALAAGGGAAAALITQPLVASIATVAYLDARIRREGLDLAIAARELSGAPIGATPSP